MEILFLSIADVLELHRLQIEQHGGEASVRDHRLLQLAVAMPAAGFSGQFFHEFPHEMAAASLFHLCANHPFVDGNKRTALAAALTFLEMNGCTFTADHQQVTDLVLAVAAGTLGKPETAVFIKKHVRPA